MFDINTKNTVGKANNTVGNGSWPIAVNVNFQLLGIESHEELESLAKTIENLISEMGGRGSDDSYKHPSGKIKGSVSVRYKNGGTVTDTLI